MGRKYKFFLLALSIVGVGLLTVLIINLSRADVLNPSGLIAQKELGLMVFATLLMLVIVIPVFVLTFFIAWKYREGNTKAKYTPNWDRNRALETIWWGFPLIIILVLSVVTWQSSHDLDPFRPLSSNAKPLTIQVVALQWRWLFIYPEQKVATLNFVQIPKNRPVQFQLTADAPMNSFWIPALGGQMYAMSGMSTELNLMADKAGTYQGRSANISGHGFANMTFDARVSSEADFNDWVKNTQQSPQALVMDEYKTLAKQSTDQKLETYTLADRGLYNKVIMKYMAPTKTENDVGRNGYH